MSKKFLGIEIGGTKIQVFLTDDQTNIIERHKFFVSEKRVAALIRDKIQEKVSNILNKNKVEVIGIGYGGPVDYRTGIVVTSYQVQGWSDFHLGQWLYELTNIPVVVDNDANTAALGEAHLGAGKNCSRTFYITLGSGVGGGLVIDDKVYHGYKPGEVEIGHIRLDKDGTILENSCSGWAVDKKIRNYIKNNPDSIIAGIVGDEKSGETKYLLQAIENGDMGADIILQETADDLAFGLSHAVHIIHPEVIILGGGLSLIGDPLIKAVEKNLQGYLMDAITPPKICLAELKEDAVCVGAALMAKKHYDSLN
ncbi:MAG: ROK family protein [Cyclobacteriaceae bacterium]|nr:ROK family protein [Cyclobacteriaceae bacterium]